MVEELKADLLPSYRSSWRPSLTSLRLQDADTFGRVSQWCNASPSSGKARMTCQNHQRCHELLLSTTGDLAESSTSLTLSPFLARFKRPLVSIFQYWSGGCACRQYGDRLRQPRSIRLPCDLVTCAAGGARPDNRRSRKSVVNARRADEPIVNNRPWMNGGYQSVVMDRSRAVFSESVAPNLALLHSDQPAEEVLLVRLDDASCTLSSYSLRVVGVWCSGRRGENSQANRQMKMKSQPGFGEFASLGSTPPNPMIRELRSPTSVADVTIVVLHRIVYVGHLHAAHIHCTL